MNHQTFFDTIRPTFGKISAPQLAGMQALLDEGAGLTLHHMANVLAQVRRETGGYMSPIKETVMPYHKDKNPSDATVIARLDKAWAAGKLGKVKKPYWRDGEFGRGQIQLTHAANRKKFGIANRDDLLKLPVSARVAVVGMRDGKFTGRKLSDYDFPAALDAPPAMNPRRIVNGQDGSDKEVAKFHREFAAALTAAGWGSANFAAPKPITKPVVDRIEPDPVVKPTAKPVVVTEPAPQAHQPPGEPLERGGDSGEGASAGKWVAAVGLLIFGAVAALVDGVKEWVEGIAAAVAAWF